MKRTHLLSVILLSLGLSAGALVHAAGRPLVADLNGANEVDGGDPDGSGHATITVNPGLGEITFTISVQDIGTATAAHIHDGEAGVNGPVVVTLAPPDAQGMVTGMATDVDRELALDIIKNPGDYYVNVHNADYPGGAVRGQLGIEDEGEDGDEEDSD
jgi:hypothetical protein